MTECLTNMYRALKLIALGAVGIGNSRFKAGGWLRMSIKRMSRSRSGHNSVAVVAARALIIRIALMLAVCGNGSSANHVMAELRKKLFIGHAAIGVSVTLHCYRTVGGAGCRFLC